MDKLKREYEKITEERNNIVGEISGLEQEPKVIQYLGLCKRNSELLKRSEELYDEILFKKYGSCHHVLVQTYTKCEYDYEGRSYRYYGCVKCGLDEGITAHEYSLTKEEREMLSVINKHQIHLDGTLTGIACDLKEGRMIYDELKKNNPSMSEEALVEFFKIAMKEKEKEKTKNLSFF